MSQVPSRRPCALLHFDFLRHIDSPQYPCGGNAAGALFLFQRDGEVGFGFLENAEDIFAIGQGEMNKVG